MRLQQTNAPSISTAHQEQNPGVFTIAPRPSAKNHPLTKAAVAATSLPLLLKR
ncbi:hypothetical protein ElyMa_002783100 [Elysia marginata]|uniref:Uncharacterized protein n=1 Tax=Elysia marginata TaxID=1093978 RepID=A0AAV4HLE8_9GAST|nr:hypothetical protein ElyMa_002783100 [Elysia marginata]